MAIYELSGDAKYAILNRIWPQMARSDFDTYMELYDKYFLFLEEQMSSVKRRSILYSTKSTDELLTLLEHIRGNVIQTKAELFNDASEEKLRSADIAVRIWLMIHIQHISADSSLPRQWRSDTSLPDLLQSWSMPTSPKLQSNGTRHIPETFSVANLNRYYGFQVKWTSDLLQHLKIDWKYKQITIFEHAICLRNHLEHPDDCPLPKHFVQEALDTIKLLFPDDKDTKAFLFRDDRKFLKIPFGRERSLFLSDFSHW